MQPNSLSRLLTERGGGGTKLGRHNRLICLCLLQNVAVCDRPRVMSQDTNLAKLGAIFFPLKLMEFFYSFSPDGRVELAIP